MFWIEVSGYTDKSSGNASVLLLESSDNSTFTTIKEINFASTQPKQSQVTLDSSKYYRIRFYAGANNIFTNAKIKVQIEYGTTKTSFVPYNSIDFKVENKNLFDKNINYTSIWQCTKEAYNNGIKLTSTTNSGVCYVQYNYPFVYRENITFSFNLSGNGKANIYLRDINNNPVKQMVNQTQTFSLTNIPTSAVTFQLYLYGDTANIGNETVFDNMMIEESSTATSYIPHAEQTCPFTFEDGQYLAEGGYLADDGIHNVMGQIVLDGSEDEHWAKETILNGVNFRIYLNTSKGSDTEITCICDYFKGVTGQQSYDSIYQNIIGIGESKNLRVRNSGFETVEDFTTWLSTHNIKVQYQLATPVVIPYTPTQQAQWNAIKKMKTYKNVSHISTEGGTLEPSNDVVYYKDLETLFNNMTA